MKPNHPYLLSGILLLAAIVTCLNIGQAHAEQLATKSKKSGLLIDFSKTDFEKEKAEKKFKSTGKEGPSSGGGGHSCALMLKVNAVELLELLDKYPPFVESGLNIKLADNLKAAKFMMDYNLPNIDKKTVEAINYPYEKEVVVEDTFCGKISTVSLAALGTLLHEVLRLSEIADTKYEVSGPFVKYVSMLKTDIPLGAAKFSNVKVNDLRTQFKNSKPIQDKGNGSILLKYGTQCRYYRENRGALYTQDFNFNRTSNESSVLEFIDPTTNTPYTAEVLTTRTEKYGILVTIFQDFWNTNYLVLRETDQGELIGEWSIIGETMAETLQIANKRFPVTGIGKRGTLAKGYSICKKSPFNRE